MNSILGLTHFYFDAACQSVVATIMASSKPSYILDLPPELILRVATHLSKRSRPSGGSDLTAFASTCSGIRATLLPMTFEEIRISSSKELESITELPNQYLPYIRNLTIHLDAGSIDNPRSSSPTRGSFVRIPSLLPTDPLPPTPPSYTTALEGLYSFLSRLSQHNLRQLSLSIPPISTLPDDVTPIASSFTQTIPDDLMLHNLQTLHLTGSTTIGPILCLTPNITALHLHLPCAFGAPALSQILFPGLQNVPKLRTLSLLLAPNLDNKIPTMKKAERRAYTDNLEASIKQACPDLEVLRIQVEIPSVVLPKVDREQANKIQSLIQYCAMLAVRH